MSIEKEISAVAMGRDDQEAGDVLSLRASALTNGVDNESRARSEKALLRKIDLWYAALTMPWMNLAANIAE